MLNIKLSSFKSLSIKTNPKCPVSEFIKSTYPESNSQAKYFLDLTTKTKPPPRFIPESKWFHLIHGMPLYFYQKDDRLQFTSAFGIAQGSFYKNRAKASIYLPKNQDLNHFIFFTTINSIFKYILAQTTISQGGTMLHASGVAYKNQTLIFAGAKGVGKSTISKTLFQHYVFGDDSVIIQEKDHRIFVDPTFLLDKNPTKKDLSPPSTIKIFFLHKTYKPTIINKIKPSTAFKLLFLRSIPPLSQKLSGSKKYLELLHQLAINAPVFKLRANISNPHQLKQIILNA